MPLPAPMTGIPVDNHRGTPPATVGDVARTLGASPEVDFLWFWDEISGWFHKSLWTPENAPIAALLDNNSTNDPLLLAMLGLAANSEIGVRVTADAVRSRPAELYRSLMTLSSAVTDGPGVVCTMGAGELRQTRPLGYERSTGLARMEDIFRLSGLLWDRDEPFDFDGNVIRFDQAYLGADRPQRRPELWALGGGPKLIDIATRYADGIEAGVPNVYFSPDDWAAQVGSVKERVEKNGRDPEAFGFGIWLGCLINEDPDVIDRTFENECLKYYAGVLGRFNQADWSRQGVESIMPPGFHYATNWLPFNETAEEVAQIVARVPPEMVRKSVYYGSPAEIGKIAGEYVGGGATFVGIVDLMPLMAPLDDAVKAPSRWLEVCAALKQKSWATS